ncbi:3-hydroxyisobutyrate dehydrogenase, mitochondrial [Orchesella cincta]|uniref:3-hydroxyisobutyrate dehydrogenase n=1 Tax=Orchesella cincta TaxID=48709 RepID=A0A1D2MG92_ORCCI|nr:3-hydroxyisobutyrate dehydrogenase, mitochondrial [Orchesella cincta]
MAAINSWRKLCSGLHVSGLLRGYGYRNSSSAGADKTIGFIGLGNMGTHMARNLMVKGHSLVVYDIQSASTVHLEKLGARVVPTPAEVASEATRIITMLPAGPHSSCIIDPVFSNPFPNRGAQPNSIFIDSSTIDSDTSKEMANVAKTKDCTYLDSPVSGGVAAAKSGTLTFMVGGPERQFREIQPLLLKMGSKVVHCGPTGAGQAAKICNNMLLGICMIGTAETMNLGIKMGLDPHLLASIINSSSGRCWSSEMYNPVPGVVDKVPASRNYEGGFGTFLMAKDLGLAQTAASGSGSSIPLGGLAYQIYQMMCSKGFSGKDFSAVFQFLQEKETKDNSTD